jgi:hypothetical protein
MNSASVSRPARRHRREKKTMPSPQATTWCHQIQLPAMPRVAISPATKRGVSAANEVATSDVPANHQGRFRPATKYSAMPPLARRMKMKPIAVTTAM